MTRGERKSAFAIFCIALVVSLSWCAPAWCEQLPIKTYTTADGLARDEISRIVQDSLGFMWFCTSEGLSRFDGYGFTNYGIDQGLPHRVVKDLLETRDGTYWIATGGGLCRFDRIAPSRAAARSDAQSGRRDAGTQEGRSKFVVYWPTEDKQAQWINSLIEDRAGLIWCATENGLYSLDRIADKCTFSAVDIGLTANTSDGGAVHALLEDHQGRLWIGAGSGLFCRWPDGRIERYTKRNGLPVNDIKSLVEDREGVLWVGTPHGLCQTVAKPDPSRTIVERLYTTKQGLPSNWVRSLFQSSDGKLWVGSLAGLAEFTPSANRQKEQFRSYTTAHGLSDTQIESIAEDRNGNLWIGTETGGAMKVAADGFTTFRIDDGLGIARIASIIENRNGELCVIDSLAGKIFINRFDGRKFHAIKPAVPASITDFGWGWNQIGFQDRTGDWWIPTDNGLCRYSNVKVDQLRHTEPKAVYTTRDGLPANQIFRAYEDHRGDIWITSIGDIPDSLARWERETEKIHLYTTADGLPRQDGPTSFCEDVAGNLWIGFYRGELARYAGGRFRILLTSSETAAGMVRGLYLDRRGRLWIAHAADGLSLADEPWSDHPSFVTYKTADGLSSNQVSCITEDQWGRIYVGTGRGLDRLDPATGRIKHYTVADGLGNNFVNVSFRDRDGVLWFGTLQGLSRLIPKPDRPPSPPPVIINSLRISGVDETLSELGETELNRIELGPSQNQIEIGFVGLSYGSGESLRYQYMLEGADHNWSAQTSQRTVNYASLQPGSYRFLVKAINADGIASSTSATVAFTIVPPIWRRWWFLAVAACFLGFAVHAVYRYRVARLIELERVRTRIATDLHDDIGSSLSQISVLSEVLNKRVGHELSVSEPLTMIGSLSRDLIDSLNDIVWAINPRRDRLSDLTYRMRRFASDCFTARDIHFRFSASDPQHDIKLGSDTRREVFLIFKEAVNNMVRHSGCTEAQIRFAITHRRMELIVTDNGKGFDSKRDNGGNGLVNMRQRAAKLDGTLDIVSSRERGTTVSLMVPIK